jgi:hypothetical protein
MSRIFRRPMFRRGGDAMTGIMHNVTPRVNHFAGTPESYVKDYTEQLREASGGYGGVDPLTSWLLRAGPRLMNEPKRHGTLATILRATEGPTEQALEDLGKKAKFERDLKLAGAQMGLDQYGKERIWEERIKASDKDEPNPLDALIFDTTEGYIGAGTYTNRYHAKNRATYDHKIQPNMIEKFGAEQVIDVELVPGKDVKEKQKQKFFSNNIGKYFYDITDNTIKKIIKNPEDPTGNALALQTFDSETLSPIDDVAPDIDKSEKEEIKITDSSLQFKLTNEQAQKEAKERGLYLLNPDDPNFEYRKLYEPNAVTQEEIELIVRKEKGKRKEKDIVQKTR